MSGEFVYRLPGMARSQRPGSHSSQLRGGGMLFRRHVPLYAQPDPRRLDVRASLRDPAEQWWVREYRQRAAIPLVVVLDLSASMGYSGIHDRAHTAVELVEAAAWSAHRSGDRFGLIGFDDTVREDCWLPVRQQRGGVTSAMEALAVGAERHAGHAGLDGVPDWLPREAGLVLLVSDFHWPDGLLERFLQQSRGHHVVPVVLWDRSEYSGWPERGFALAQDMESGERRLLWLRQGWSDQVASTYAAREADLRRLCEHFGTRPLFLRDGFSADAMNAYFLGLDA